MYTTNKHAEFLFSIEFTRKPHLLEDVTTEIDCMDIPYDNIQTIHNLPYISIDRFAIHGFYSDAFEQYGNRDDEGNKIYHPQFWVTEQEGEWYLIDNQGYDYARYVTRLNNYRRVRRSGHVSVLQV